jgi:hypothetical protein
VEHPVGSQQPTVGESSHAVEEHAGSSDVTHQHAMEQQHDEETVPAAVDGIFIGQLNIERAWI